MGCAGLDEAVSLDSLEEVLAGGVGMLRARETLVFRWQSKFDFPALRAWVPSNASQCNYSSMQMTGAVPSRKGMRSARQLL